MEQRRHPDILGWRLHDIAKMTGLIALGIPLLKLGVQIARGINRTEIGQGSNATAWRPLEFHEENSSED